jgi:hypothetical protein
MSKPVIVALLAAVAVAGCSSPVVSGQAGHPAGSAGTSASPRTGPTVLAAPPTRWGSQPPRSVTPGADHRSRAAICPYVSTLLAAGHPARAVIARVYAEYGIAASQRHRYRIDRLVPLDLDGTSSIRNLWPQPARAFRAKNRLGARLHALVCSGQLTLGSAQRAMQKNWNRAYRHYLAPAPPRSAPPSAPAPPPAASAPVPPPPPARPSAPAGPPPPGPPPGCHPTTSTGHCYEPGEFCSDADHGLTGVAGDGKAIECEDNGGWRWEPI